MLRLLCISLACSSWLQACAQPDLQVHRHLEALSSERPTFEPGDKVEHFDSRAGGFRVHYTRSGRHAVPADDADGDKLPDYVTRVAADFDRVLAFYKDLGYREPARDGAVPGEHGGDDRIDVYLEEFAIGGAVGQFLADTGCDAQPCGGYMILENDFRNKGYPNLEIAIRLVSSHELFHAIQSAYATNISGLLSEGTAVWASEAFDAEAGDLERQARPYFERPDSSLAEDPAGTDPIRYGASIFFEHIDEHADRNALRRMFEILADSADEWPAALDAALKEQGSSIAAQFASFAEWNLFTADRADPERAYKRGDQLPKIKETAVDPGYSDEAVRVFPLAARYYTLKADAADSVSAKADLSDDKGVEDLQLMIAVEHAGNITTVEHAEPAQQRELEAKLEAGDTAHIVLFNAAHSGGSIRPDLCITTASSKDGCTSKTKPDAGTPKEPAAESSSGCAVLAPRPQPTGPWLLGLSAVASLLTLRRKRSRKNA
jgi:hypothetical protein